MVKLRNLKPLVRRTPISSIKKTHKKPKRFFFIVFPMRVNQEMIDLMDYWIKHPSCVDAYHKPLFTSRSHLVKCALIKEFSRLKELYSDTQI